MPNKSSKKNKKFNKSESDSEYLLKLVIYLIIGSIWLKVTIDNNSQVPIPLGFILGLILASHEHFKIDRKIEYAVLLVAVLIGFWLPIGIFISM